MDLINTFSILVISTIFLTWLWLKHKFSYWKNRGVVSPPYGLSDITKALSQKECLFDSMLNLYNFFKAKGLRHGGIYFMHLPQYIPVDLNIVKSIMQVDFPHFVDRGHFVNEKVDPLSAHLISLEGKKWKLLRNKLTPTFTSGKMRMMFKTLVNCTAGIHKVMDNEVGKAVDIKDILARFTTDVIASCAFGLECNSLEDPNNEFRISGKKMFEIDFVGNIKQIFYILFPDLFVKLNIRLTSPSVEKFIMGVVKDTVKYREENNVYRKDFMHLLIQLKNMGKLVDDDKLQAEDISEEDNKITIEEIAAQAFIFFGAGFETSSTTMTFFLYELAKNREIQDKVREEIKKVLAKHNGQLTYDAVMDMDYLEQTINETLRKYPPLAGLNRKCTKDYKVPGTDVVLTKGTRVMIPIVGIQHDPDYYPNPEKFDPDRFSEENKKTRPAFTFLPFGEGPRVCIGLRFGMLQTKVGLIVLLLNYEFTVNEKTQEPLKFETTTFITSTEGGVWLNVRKITI